jgi:HemY protein
MRRWIISFAIGLIGLPLLLRLIELDDGFVVLVFGQTTVEMPLWFVFTCMLLFSITSYYLVRTLHMLWRSPRLMNRWLNKRGLAKTHNLTVSGFLSLLEGNWTSAGRDLLKAADKSQAPILNYLLAARARLENEDLAGAESLLNKAEELMPEARIAIGIYHAQLLQQVELYDEAHNILSTLAGEKPKHAMLQKMLMASYRQRGEAQKVLGLFPALQKLKVLPSADMEKLLRETCVQIVEQTTTAEALAEHWSLFPVMAQHNVVVISAYCRALLRYNQCVMAEELLRKTLTKHWQADLVTLYGQTRASDALKQLQTAEQWLKHHPEDDELILALARICQRNQLRAKARDYYQDYIRRTQSTSAQEEMAHLTQS